MKLQDPIARALGTWASEITLPSVLLRLSLALLFAALIGWERANKRHSAGLRTFILVSLASALAMLLDVFLMTSFGTPFALEHLHAAAIGGLPQEPLQPF